jgi:hypothetical protein
MLAVGVAVAQQAPFNEAGVTMGHWHLVSHDVAANKKIFVAMGGTPVTRGTAEGVRFPGARVNLNLGEEPPGKGGSVGSKRDTKISPSETERSLEQAALAQGAADMDRTS